MEFKESNWTFAFSSEWRVIRFDTHPHFIALSGSGFKAIDFLAVHPEKGLLLLEVKYYRKRHRTSRPYPELEEISDILEQKFSDTLKAIHIIERYLERKGTYRFVHRWLQHPMGRRLFSNWSFWNAVIRTAKDPNRVLRWAFIEYDQLSEQVKMNWRSDVAERLRERTVSPPENIQLLGDPLQENQQLFSLQKQ
ncbi:MAG: nuclease-related domain-containing protein [Bacteroidota bacterium]